MLDQLKRRAAADPENASLRLNYLVACQRAGKTGEVLSCLADREQWNKTHENEQDLAIAEISRRLPGFELSGVRLWSCENRIAFDARSGVYDSFREGDRVRVGETIIHCDGKGWHEKQTISHRLATFKHKATGIEMQLIPGFEWVQFVGGSRRIVEGRIDPFLIARFPVTNWQAWRTHMRNGTGDSASMYDAPAHEKDWPATGSSFDEVKGYADDVGLEIPTAAQWEYACKAGASTKFYFGDEFDPSHVWYAGNSVHSCNSPGEVCRTDDRANCGPQPHSPKEHDDAGKWNGFGLVDCIGNVDEWLNDERVAGGSSLSHPSTGLGSVLTYEEMAVAEFTGFRPIKSIEWSEK